VLVQPRRDRPPARDERLALGRRPDRLERLEVERLDRRSLERVDRPCVEIVGEARVVALDDADQLRARDAIRVREGGLRDRLDALEQVRETPPAIRERLGRSRRKAVVVPSLADRGREDRFVAEELLPILLGELGHCGRRPGLGRHLRIVRDEPSANGGRAAVGL